MKKKKLWNILKFSKFPETAKFVNMETTFFYTGKSTTGIQC